MTPCTHITSLFKAAIQILGRSRCLLMLLVSLLTARADWSIVSATGLGEPTPGVEVIETRCINGNQTARVTALCFE
jgi:hypothetical protein